MALPKFLLYKLEDDDPAVNAAFEEYLFRRRRDNEHFFLTYRNRPCVVIGRNQNPWLECDLQYLVQQGIPLLRRLSGGGTVYHDLGNLNYSFILPRQEYDPKRIMGLMQTALHRLHIPADMCDRHSLWLQGRKIAGSAFFLTGKSAFLHGCLLLNTDLRRLQRALTVVADEIDGDAVRSVLSPVMNISAYRAAVDGASVRNAILDVLRDNVMLADECCLRRSQMLDDPDFCKFLAQYSGWQWTYGRTPAFKRTLQVKQHDFCCRLQVDVCRGHIQTAALETDSVKPAIRQMLEKLLCEQPFEGRALASIIEKAACSGKLTAADGRLFSQWFREAAGLTVSP